MNKQDFLKLVGAQSERVEYLPVAFMLCGGYGCAGYFNSELNKDLTGTCVLLNMRVVALGGEASSAAVSIQDFHDFLERVVSKHYRESNEAEDRTNGDTGFGPQAAVCDDSTDLRGETIPLAGVDYRHMLLLYPVAHISALMQRAEESFIEPVPTFLDFRNKSLIVKVLSTQLW